MSVEATIEATAKCDASVDPGKAEVKCKGSCEVDASAMAECDASATVKCVGTAPDQLEAVGGVIAGGSQSAAAEVTGAVAGGG